MGKRFANQAITGLGLPAMLLAAAILFAAGVPNPRAAGDQADSAMQSIRPESIRAEMRFLSDDSLEGRGTGMRG